MEQLQSLPSEMFSFDVSSLIAGFLFGVIGFWRYREGKRKSNRIVIFISVALMIYPYFTEGAFLNWFIGFALCGSAYYYW